MNYQSLYTNKKDTLVFNYDNFDSALHELLSRVNLDSDYQKAIIIDGNEKVVVSMRSIK